MSQFLITINSIWILDFKIQKKYSMIAYKVFFHKLNYLRKSIFTSFPTYQKFWIFLLTAAKHELYADFHH